MPGMRPCSVGGPVTSSPLTGRSKVSLMSWPKVSLQYATMLAGTIHWPIQSCGYCGYRLLVVRLGSRLSFVWRDTHPGLRCAGGLKYESMSGSGSLGFNQESNMRFALSARSLQGIEYVESSESSLDILSGQVKTVVLYGQWVKRVKAVALYCQALVIIDTRPAGLRERQ